MSDKSISEEEAEKKLNEVKSLNPIIMSSMQFADISPNYEQIDSLSINGLLSILSNPSVETDLKIFCSELLVKQQRMKLICYLRLISYQDLKAVILKIH